MVLLFLKDCTLFQKISSLPWGYFNLGVFDHFRHSGFHDLGDFGGSWDIESRSNRKKPFPEKVVAMVQNCNMYNATALCPPVGYSTVAWTQKSKKPKKNLSTLFGRRVYTCWNATALDLCFKISNSTSRHNFSPSLREKFGPRSEISRQTGTWVKMEL